MNTPPPGVLNDGGPAHPVNVIFHAGETDLIRGEPIPKGAPNRRYFNGGMNTRDTVAMHFAAALLANKGFDGCEEKAMEIVEETGFKLADAFITSKQTQMETAIKNIQIQAALAESAEIGRRSVTGDIVAKVGQAQGNRIIT